MDTDKLSVLICVTYGTAYAYICGFIFKKIDFDKKSSHINLIAS